MPDAVDDRSEAIRLAEQAVTGTESHRAYRYFQLARGLAHYRAGEHEQAVERLRASIDDDGTRYRNVAAELLLSMAYRQLGENGESAAALARAHEVTSHPACPRLEHGELGPVWHDWIFVNRLLQQAERPLPASP